MTYPDEFLKRMEEITEDNFELFLKSTFEKPCKGVRINTAKADFEKIVEILELNKKSPFSEFGFYVENLSGNHPLHHAGAIYFQEPSAMSAVTALNPKEGDRVLDICAAPGGKTTQIASKVGETGVVWSNEYVFKRTQILISNIERLGLKNTVVSSIDTAFLSKKLEGFFDKVLVDAPCSGEGMMKKEPEAIKNWSIENIRLCAERQLEILHNASLCLKDGGMMVYSTCTFAPEENEMVVASFLEKHPEFRLEKIASDFGVGGIKKYALNTENIEFCRRIFPFNGGEGHFVALMRKDGASNIPQFSEKTELNGTTNLFLKFFNENFENKDDLIVFNKENKVYIKPNIPSFNDVGIVRMGVYAGEVVKNRFEPSHALFSAFGKRCKNKIDLSLNDTNLLKFLHGEEIETDIHLKGYTAVLVEGIPLGFGKASNGRLKNKYPKGLRLL